MTSAELLATNTNLPLALTAGEPAGIGYDLCVKLAQEAASALPPLVVIGDTEALQERADFLSLPLTVLPYVPEMESTCGDRLLTVLDCPLADTVKPGVLNVANAPGVMRMLDIAIDGCLSGRFSGMITGPVQKSLINEAGIPFTGHTEYLARRAACEQVVMMLASESLRVALVTTHLPLARVPAAITPELLTAVIGILHHDLISRFGLADPRIAVCGLNPHAGEQGHLGREELDVIIPTLDKLRTRGMQLSGPLPADTIFTPRVLDSADAVLAMYHDQGLPVLKFQSFGRGVNITLGLPFIRTSVDHGTALDIAGTGNIDSGSLLQAIEQAAIMSGHSVVTAREC